MQTTRDSRRRERVKRVTPFTVWLQEQLDRYELTQSEFARRAGIGSPAVVNRWLSGEAKPSVALCLRIAGALRVDLDFVLEKAGYRPPSNVGEVDERGGILASMVKRVRWDSDTRYSTVYRIVRGYLEDDRLAETEPDVPG